MERLDAGGVSLGQPHEWDLGVPSKCRHRTCTPQGLSSPLETALKANCPSQRPSVSARLSSQLRADRGCTWPALDAAPERSLSCEVDRGARHLFASLGYAQSKQQTT
eukprot:3932739-Rhodomonas_salina.2